MATSSIREKLKKKYSTSEEEKKEPEKIQQKQQVQTVSIDPNSTRGQLRAKYDAVYSQIDENYINTYIKDASSYLQSAETQYTAMDTGDKNFIFNARKNTYHNLSDRGFKIRQWLDRNKTNIDADTYNSFMTTLDDIDQASASTINEFYHKATGQRDLIIKVAVDGKPYTVAELKKQAESNPNGIAKTERGNTTWKELYEEAEG